MSGAVFPHCVTSRAGDECREYSFQNVPSDKSKYSLGDRVHLHPQRVSETRTWPGGCHRWEMWGGILDHCCDRMTQLHLLTFHTENQAAAASPGSCSVTCKVQVWKWKPGRKVTWSERASTLQKSFWSTLFLSLCQAQIPHAKTLLHSQCWILP